MGLARAHGQQRTPHENGFKDQSRVGYSQRHLKFRRQRTSVSLPRLLTVDFGKKNGKESGYAVMLGRFAA